MAALRGASGTGGAPASGGSTGQVDGGTADVATSDGPGSGSEYDGAFGGAGGSPSTSGGAGGGAGRAGSGGAGGAASATGGAPSLGGRSGTAGAGAATQATGGAAGGGGAGGAADGCFPSCLDSLVQSCPTTGTCTFAISIQPAGANVCFGNGVKAQNETGVPATKSTVKNANGSLCYTLETNVGNSGVTYAWKNPAGTTVATATVANATMNMMTVMCDGTSYLVNLDSTACDGQSTQPNTTNCTVGTCAY